MFERQREGDVGEAEQGAVRVAERERQAARRVAEVEVPAELEAVAGFEEEAERREQRDRPPAEGEMALDERGEVRGRCVVGGVVSHRHCRCRCRLLLGHASS